MDKKDKSVLKQISVYKTQKLITNEFFENIEKVFEIFGINEGLKVLLNEYNQTAQFEQEYTKLRWTVYTTLTTVSFAIAGFVLSTLNSMDVVVKTSTLFFAWAIQFVATFFYWWMHKLTHRFRDYLVQFELILGGYRYTLRKKRPVPKWHFFKKEIQFKFHWVICGITILYLLGVILFSFKAKILINIH